MGDLKYGGQLRVSKPNSRTDPEGGGSDLEKKRAKKANEREPPNDGERDPTFLLTYLPTLVTLRSTTPRERLHANRGDFRRGRAAGAGAELALAVFALGAGGADVSGVDLLRADFLGLETVKVGA